MIIRLATEADIPQLLPLMRGLAIFERYIDDFAVTEVELREQGFRRWPPDFYCLVAAAPQHDGPDQLYGMLVYYFVPFTLLAKPTLFIKELFVAAEGRGQGIGTRLMQAAAAEALRHGCGAMRWYVASWNEAGMRFYERLGATPNPDWIDYSMSAATLRRLADPQHHEQPDDPEYLRREP